MVKDFDDYAPDMNNFDDWLDHTHYVRRGVPAALLVEDERRVLLLGKKLYEQWLEGDGDVDEVQQKIATTIRVIAEKYDSHAERDDWVRPDDAGCVPALMREFFFRLEKIGRGRTLQRERALASVSLIADVVKDY